MQKIPQSTKNMSDPHNLDSGNIRDVVSEGNAIKADLTQSKQAKFPIEFTSLAESSIPNNSARKILGQQIKVEYIPDFFYSIRLCQILFTIAKKDGKLKKVDEFNIHSFTIYLSYAMIYQYYKVTNEVNANPNIDIEHILTVFKSSGFDQIKVPILLSHWMNAIGRYVPTDIKRQFLPLMTIIDTAGDYFDNYFYTGNTAHLLPNFRLMFSIALLKSNVDLATVARHERTSRFIECDDYPNVPWLAHTQVARNWLQFVPGCTKLLQSYSTDDELNRLLQAQMLVTNYPDNISRYLMLNSNILIQLKLANQDIFRYIDNINTTNISSVGSDMTMIPLVEETHQNVITPTVTTAAIAAVNRARAVIEHVKRQTFDHDSRVKSRIEIVNGIIDYVSQTPLVRLSVEENAVIINNHNFNDPQDPWYSQSIEYQTAPATIAESHSYFSRK